LGPFDSVVIVIVEVAPLVVAVIGFGENDTLVLEGFPVALNVTELLAPILVTVMVAVPELPRCTVREGADVERLKSGVGAETITVTSVECGPAEVSVPVMVTL
jgi:hypothetical protein